MSQKRYIGNKRSRRVHDRTNLTERCNSDGIAERANLDEGQYLKALADGWKPCKWCSGPKDYR